MFHCFTHSTSPYNKGLFILILLFVILEYLLNSVGNPRDAEFNNSSSTSSLLRYSSNQNSSFYKLLSYKNTTTAINMTVHQIGTVQPYLIQFYQMDDMNYIITVPSFLITNLQTSTISNKQNLSESNQFGTRSENQTITSDLPKCPDIPEYLYGQIRIIKAPVPLISDLESRFQWLYPGGHWTPAWCHAEYKVALVIPYRCRGEHLLLFLQHMHPFLQKQLVDYTIFVVEQDGDGPFNRAMLMNIGYVEALKRQKFNCFIFHDIDLLPEDDRNLYACPQQPRHMSVAVDLFHYKLPYPAIFGGVSAISTKHFKLLNGFSNSFWGWGGEDDDMSNRIRHHHLNITRYPITIARYTMLTHKKNRANPKRYEILKSGTKRYENDGLNNLSYELIDSKNKLLYTWILVKLPIPDIS